MVADLAHSWLTCSAPVAAAQAAGRAVIHDHDGTVLACVEGNLTSRRADRLTNDVHSDLLVVVLDLHLLQHLGGAQERNAAPR